MVKERWAGRGGSVGDEGMKGWQAIQVSARYRTHGEMAGTIKKEKKEGDKRDL